MILLLGAVRIYQQEGQSSECLAGAGVYISDMAHSHGCWQGHHVGILMGGLSVPRTSYLAFLRTKDLKGNEQAGAFHDLVFKLVHHYFYYFLLFIKIESLSLASTQRGGKLVSSS